VVVRVPAAAVLDAPQLEKLHLVGQFLPGHQVYFKKNHSLKKKHAFKNYLILVLVEKNVSQKITLTETILFVQISIQQNSTCSAWIDTADLVQAQDLDVFDEDGNAAHEAYLDIRVSRF
jgi:hypothetical protein